MIIGVPTFAVIYYIVELYISQRLKKRNLPTESICYDGINYVDDEGKYTTYVEKSDIKEDEERGE